MDYNYSDNYVRQRNTDKQTEQAHTEHVGHHDHSEMVKAESNKTEYYKSAGVISVIMLSATVMSTVVGFDWQEWMRWFMGGFFVFFGSFKLIGYEMFILMFPSYDPIAKRFKLYNYFYPFIELLLGFLYCANLYALPRDIITLVFLSIGAWGVLKSIPRGETVKCACLGNIIKLPLSTVTLVEDVAMASMALIMIISHFAL